MYKCIVSWAERNTCKQTYLQSSRGQNSIQTFIFRMNVLSVNACLERIMISLTIAIARSAEQYCVQEVLRALLQGTSLSRSPTEVLNKH